VIPARMRLQEDVTAIRPFASSDLGALLELRRRNLDFMAPFEPTRSPSFYSRAGQARELDLDDAAWRVGAGFAFAVLDAGDDDRLIGRVALGNVVRGPWQNATLGYWIDQDANGRGHCTRAVALVVRFAFEHAGLHRVQPAIMPRNDRSKRVVAKVGFRHEGRAERYLEIAGVWEDHELFALTIEDWQARDAAPG
jgi:[ribosomal protein S5]-alanine N-acetyltransferase